jgi:hypothetical protein
LKISSLILRPCWTTRVLHTGPQAQRGLHS